MTKCLSIQVLMWCVVSNMPIHASMIYSTLNINESFENYIWFFVCLITWYCPISLLRTDLFNLLDTSHTGYLLDCFVKYKNIISNRFESIYLFSVTLGVWTVNSVAHIAAFVFLVRIAHVAVFVGTVRFLNWAPILEVASNTGVCNIAMIPS